MANDVKKGGSCTNKDEKLVILPYQRTKNNAIYPRTEENRMTALSLRVIIRLFLGCTFTFSQFFHNLREAIFFVQTLIYSCANICVFQILN